MAIKPGDLTSILNQTKLSKDNPALYQFLRSQVQVISEIATAFNTGDFDAQIQAILSASRALRFVEPHTGSGPKSVILSDVVISSRAVVVKDIDGNAAANNITLTGTVDGVANPVINTNFGVFRVYKSAEDGAFHEW